MSNKSADEIVELARQRIAANRQQQHLRHIQARQQYDYLWRTTWLAVLGSLMLALLALPGVPLQWRLYAIVHGLVAQQHNIFVGGMQLPLCARNLGIYSSFLVTIGYLWVRGRQHAGGFPPRPITITLLTLVLIMIVDGFNSMAATMGRVPLYPPYNVLRILTGIGMGMAIAVAFLAIFNQALRQNVQRRQRVVQNWDDMAVIVTLNLLIPIVIYADLGFMYWPLAFLAFVGIISEVYAMNVLLASLFMGYRRSITSLTQLARPATVAFLPTILLIGGLALLRFWWEAQSH